MLNEPYTKTKGERIHEIERMFKEIGRDIDGSDSETEKEEEK